MSVFDDLMDEPVGSEKEKSTALLVKKDNYHKLVAFRNVHSYSQEMQLQACPKRYEIMCLEAGLKTDGIEVADDNNVTFAFGHAVGAGVAEYDKTQDRDKAIFAAFLAWDVDLFAEEPKRPNRPPPNKSFHHAVWAIMGYEVFYAEDQDACLSEYEVVQVEANVGVDFEDGFYYTAHIDELLRHRHSGALRVKENKTTGFAEIDPALYQNSDQGLGYSVVADTIGQSEYSVLYCIYSSTTMRWIPMEFVKNSVVKAQWLQGQLLTNSEVREYEQVGLFPKRGRSCIEYGRRCKYFDTCGFDLLRVFKRKFSDLPSVTSLEDIEIATGDPFDYKFTLTQLLSNQKERA